MSHQEDASNIKKSVLMRYPVSFLEEVSRALIGYKSYRDLKQYYRALPVLDTLLDYVTLDPATRKRVYDLTAEERRTSQHHFIDIHKTLLEDFRDYYHGPRNDGQLALKLLAPGESLDLKRGIVVIRQPIPFLEAWGRFDPEHIITLGGFYYRQTRYQATPAGLFPYEVKVPMIDFADPNLQYNETDTIPYSKWTEMYDSGWEKISPICTMIEKLVAKALEDAGYSSDGTTVSKNTPARAIDGEGSISKKERLKL